MLVGLVPSKGCEGKSVSCFSSTFWWFAGNLCHPLASATSPRSLPSSSHGIPLVCMCLSSKFPFYKGTNDIGLGALPTLVQPLN